MATTYKITIGETGNNTGHVKESAYKGDLHAIDAARRMVKPYRGAGWYKIEDGARLVARGGRA